MFRYLEPHIRQDLQEKMVFVGGPRQVGKTTLSFHLIGEGADETHPAYLNWDLVETKKTLPRGILPANQPLIVLDEIHKYVEWRNLIKGFYDKYKSRNKFLITGSARLDFYRRGGDSMQGRYHYYRLHPFSIVELSNEKILNMDALLTFGGFPEPYLKQDQRHWKRWQRERKTQLVKEDLLSLEQVRELSQIELLVEILPERVGSLLSINNLKQDLSVSFETAERYVKILENLYYCFRIAPYSLKKIRSVKKERKLYLWDWSLCESKGTKIENLVASQLLKYCHFIEDTEGDNMELSFMRDSAGHEIDFIVLKNKKPLFAVECKSGDYKISSSIRYFSNRVEIPNFYQVHLGTKDYEVPEHRLRIVPLEVFCRDLKLV